MKYFFLAAILFLLSHCRSYQAATTQNKQPDTLIRLYAFGLPYFPTYQEESKLATKWGFYREEAGCMFSQQELDSLKACNKIAEQPLVAKHGKNWQEKFQRELRSLTTSKEHAIELLYMNDRVAAKRIEMETHGDSIFYHFNPSKQHGIYDVDILGWQNKEWVSFFRYKVNYIDQLLTLKRKSVKTAPSYLTDNLYFNESQLLVIPR